MSTFTCPRCREPAYGRTEVVDGERVCSECAEYDRNEVAMNEDHQRHIDALDEGEEE